ncbi:MAG TPA: hypothetical protein VGX68_10265 [Thermoanaerobaculia bacterium]|jgi:hypothetical protein|nr:hypothetical protein [Thermoanaerobaculia bacterium]
MPNNSALADFILKWKRLVNNVLADMNSGVLPDLEMYRGPLADLLDEVLELSSELQSRRGVKQQGHKELEVLKRKGRYHASKLSSALKAHYGPQSEELLKYGIPPVRSRPRPAGESEGPTPVIPPEPAPETQAPETAEASKPEGPAPTPQDTASQKS